MREKDLYEIFTSAALLIITVHNFLITRFSKDIMGFSKDVIDFNNITWVGVGELKRSKPQSL